VIRVWWVCAAILAASGVLVAADMVPSYYIGLMIEVMILALFVMSLDLLVGLVGLDSLGHAAFFGIGAYIAGLLSQHGFEDVGVLLLAAITGGLVMGLVFGAIALRAVGPYFLIITLALGYLPAALAIRWRGLTGGDDGLVMAGRPTLAGISLDSPSRYFFLVSAVLLLSIALMGAIARSTFGLGLRGIKESPARMNALGYRTWIYQYVIFVIAAAFASIAGALNAFYNLFVSPADFGIDRSFGALVAVILGGAGTLVGPAIGSAVIMLMRHSVGAVTQHWAMVLGLFYIAVVLYAPRGLAFGLRDLFSGGRPFR
jgi:branched-chain amino acid transport system permease protein